MQISSAALGSLNQLLVLLSKESLKAFEMIQVAPGVAQQQFVFLWEDSIGAV